jgi:hypothetical protein
MQVSVSSYLVKGGTGTYLTTGVTQVLLKLVGCGSVF